VAYRRGKRDYYYHITKQKWPNSVLLKPRSDGDNRGYAEPMLARTCVGPTVSQCLCSVPLNISNASAMYVYRTKTRVTTQIPHGVYDSKFTGERWIKRSVRFVKVATIAKCTVQRLTKRQIRLGLHYGSVTDNHNTFIDFAASTLEQANISDKPQ